MALYGITKEKDGVVYTVSNGGNLVITSAQHAKYTNLMIPAEVQGMPVTGIASRAFVNSKVKTVLLPQTVTFIGERAFASNTNLKSVTFKADKVQIQKSAFEHCYKLQVVKGNSIELIGENVFSGCKNLDCVAVKIGGKIPVNSFANCKRIAELAFLDGVSIDMNAFYGCMSINKLHFETNVTLSPYVMKFIEKRKIFCKPDSPLVELMYSGTDIQITA